MQERLDPMQANPAAYQAMIGLEQYIRQCSLEHSLVELVKIRASQLNGCAFCLHMHTSDARASGESEERLYLLSAWREAPLYTSRERAALAWTEALTLLAESGAPDAEYQAAQQQFSDSELVDLTLLIGVINSWNRLAVGFRRPPEFNAAALQAARG